MANGEQPALLVIHNDENDWLIGDGTSDPDDSVIVHISHVVALDTRLPPQPPTQLSPVGGPSRSLRPPTEASSLAWAAIRLKQRATREVITGDWSFQVLTGCYEIDACVRQAGL